MLVSNDEREALHGAIHRLEQRWIVSPITDAKWHVYDRLPFWDFIEGLRKARALTDGRRFVDLGCGIGTNMAIAHHLGWEVAGIDKRAEYVAAARELVPEAHVVRGELMELESIDADVIYMYRPARSENREKDLEDHVRDVAADGAVMFWPFRGDVWRA